MSFAPTDSELFGPLFATDAMRGCFSDTAWAGSMLAVEAALGRSEARAGLAPATPAWIWRLRSILPPRWRVQRDGLIPFSAMPRRSGRVSLSSTTEPAENRRHR
jgi:hypothetical protein